MKINLTELIGSSFYSLHHAMAEDKYNRIWCKGGRGSLKSSFISIEILLGIIRDPLANAIIMRRYDNELRDTVYNQVVWACEKLQITHLFKFSVSPMQIIHKETGQRIIFKGADNPGKTKSISLTKGYIKYAWFEELDQFGGMEEIRTLLQSFFRGGDYRRVALFSYNPPKSARSWVNHEARIAQDGKITHHSNYLSAPVEWIGGDFIQMAQHLKQVNEMAYRHEYMGEEVGTGLEVFNNIKIQAISDKDAAMFDNIRQGLDFGYAVDPLSFIRLHYDARRRRLYLFDEVSGIGISNRDFAHRVNPLYKQIYTTADSAEPKSIDELRNDYGMRMKGARKGAGSIEHGIKWLSDLEAIIIDPVRCPLSAKEFINYALEINRAGDTISKYPDKDNHTIDAVRYAMEDDMTARAKISKGITAGRLGL